MTTPLLTPHTDTAFQEIVDELTRRGFLAGGLGSAALIGLAACGSSGSHGGVGAPSATQEWSFTDDLARPITLTSKPTRIVALVDGIAQSLWPFGIHVVAAPVDAANTASLTLAGISASQRAAISNIGSDQINVEAVAAARPDLLVDLAVDGKLASLQDTPQLAKIAPMVGLNMNRPLDQITVSVSRLASSLGLAASPSLQQAKQDYATAMTALRQALQRKPTLRVLVCTSGGANVLVYVEKDWSFMQTLAEAGMNFTPAAGSYFQQVSWEDVPQLPADLILFMGQTLPTNPAWNAMPAVKAGHVEIAGTAATNWQVDTYATYTTQMAVLTAAVNAA